MYKLEGFDEGWLTIGESPLVTYSNLGYGDYVFKVKASNSDGVWNEQETSLHLSILPSILLVRWAYCFYVLFFMGCLVCVIFYFKKDGIIGSNIVKWKCLNKRKEREVYHAKIDFFTNVAHEIRTPLTLIKGPLENIIPKRKWIRNERGFVYHEAEYGAFVESYQSVVGFSKDRNGDSG